ncbi:MAG: helix-turn-helix domain-containing protein [bacterium]|nr:helix-turn-helix domain-containing protein [bacterium]
MIHTLKKVFEDIGLNKKEQVVLLHLVQYGSQRVREVARSTRLERTTTYGILKNLIAKGLVSSSGERGVAIFQAIEPEALLDYIERMRVNLDERKKEVKEVLPQLKTLRRKREIFPRIQFFEGKEGVKQAYEDSLKNNKGKLVVEFTGADAIYRLMGKEWADYYVAKRVRLGITCRAIAPESDWGRYAKNLDAQVNRVTKLIDPKYRFDTAIDIYDDKVAIFSFSKEEPMGVIIEDEPIARTLRTLFEYVSDTAPET